MNKLKFIFYSDIDGVLTPPRKLFQCFPRPDEAPNGAMMFHEREDDRWSKEYSDRDSWAMLRLKDHLVFISHDKRNEEYVKYKGHKFVYAPHSKGDKSLVLNRDWNDRLRTGEVVGESNKPVYLYIGDGLFDYQCLREAKFGFIPDDADPLLVAKLHSKHMLPNPPSKATLDKVAVLVAGGGNGCISEAIFRLYSSGAYLQEDFLKGAKIFDEIEKYLGSE